MFNDNLLRHADKEVIGMQRNISGKRRAARLQATPFFHVSQMFGPIRTPHLRKTREGIIILNDAISREPWF